MKIFQVANVRWYNATSWYALYLSKLLEDAGHDVLVICLEGTETHEKAREMGLETFCLNLNAKNPFDFGPLFKDMWDLTRALKPQVVNCHRGESFILWGIIKSLTRSFRLVRTRGDQRPPKNNVFNRWLHTDMADAVVATNTFTANYFRDDLGVPTDKLWIILGGVERDKYTFDHQGRERVRQEFGYTDKHKVVGILGRFDEVKGHKQAIQAVADLYHNRGMKDVRLLLIGFDTAMSTESVKQMMRENQVEDICRITGHRQDVAACISALDLGLVSSLWSETIARAALEIMSCGVPLVGTRVGVMPDLLSKDALVDTYNAGIMANLLAKALTDENMLPRLAFEQKQKIDTLGGENFLRQSLNLYRGIL